MILVIIDINEIHLTDEFIIEINKIHLTDEFIIEINKIHLTDVFIDDDNTDDELRWIIIIIEVRWISLTAASVPGAAAFA